MGYCVLGMLFVDCGAWSGRGASACGVEVAGCALCCWTPHLTCSVALLLGYCSTELTELVVNTGAGFLVMGFVGFVVKLIHIPINNIIVG